MVQVVELCNLKWLEIQWVIKSYLQKGFNNSFLIISLLQLDREGLIETCA